MINSRDIDELHPRVAKKCRQLIADCALEGIDLLVTSTYRDKDSQAELYAQGRTKPGRIVTKARPGYSYHQHRVAFDVVPLKNGKPIWDVKGLNLQIWNRVGEIGESLGLEWGRRWKNFSEWPHFQLTEGLSVHDFMAGKKLPG